MDPPEDNSPKQNNRLGSLTWSQLRKIYKDQSERKKEQDKKKKCLKRWGCLN